MLLSHTKRLCTLLPTLIAATPQFSDPNRPVPFPASLQRAVPVCAQPCLQTSLLERFPLVCTSPFSLSCLCSRYSTTGEALGEVALGCIYSSCPADDAEIASAYGVCLGQEDAVTPTRSALTVVVPAITRTSNAMSSSSIAVSTKATSIHSSSQTTPSSTKVAFIDFISMTTSTSTTSSTSLPSSSALATSQVQGHNPRTMKPAQIAGLAVAAAAVFIVAIGLMTLSVFLRRRKEKKNTFASLEKNQNKPSKGKPARFSHYVPTSRNPYLSPQRQTPTPRSKPQIVTQSSQVAPQTRPQRSTQSKETGQNLRLYALQSIAAPGQVQPPDLSSQHPLLRPDLARTRNTSNYSIPLEPIGVAVSAELPGSSVAVPQHVSNHEPRRQRSRAARPTLRLSQRPDSVLTQHTVFEEDEIAARRRSSALLPTPPIPIPPIRSFQPSRPQIIVNNTSKQPGLSLNIPIRHSRTQIERVVPVETSPLATPPAVTSLAAPIQMTSTRDRAVSSAGRSERSGVSDIPDYYFTGQASSQVTPKASPLPSLRIGELSRSNKIKTKPSSSTISRRSSRASTNFRDSYSSQTSFESMNDDDPTPEDEDEEKQLSDSRLSPVAESPISNLRYPKVPRASNQLVPRSPRSPQSFKSQNSPLRTSPLRTSPLRPNPLSSFPEPSALLVKRRGEKEAANLEKQLQMDSPRRTEVRDYMKNYRQHLRSSTVERGWSVKESPAHTQGSSRVQSGQWPKSPAMYDADTVQPLSVLRAKEQQQQQEPPSYAALKSPLWVPRLTPTRHGDDLFISVSYSKPGN